MAEEKKPLDYTPNPKLTKRKDIKKVIRGILQALVLASLLSALIFAIIDYPQYQPFASDDLARYTGVDNGFIALSYFGISRVASDDQVSARQLESQLRALRDSGYVAITQQELFDYYESGKPLPERAMFLLFEDDRCDTTIFAQPVLQDMNMMATMLTYAENLTSRGNKYLRTKDVKNMMSSTYWENGTSGYRLSYINVFDRYGRYLGEMNVNEYSNMRRYLGRDYNHYLMDFIRDQDDIPKESYTGLQERILGDYEAMARVYEKELGQVPELYVLMHSNTGAFASNERASKINEAAIKAMFRANFNREGPSLNTRDIDVYDLTRIQPQPYWHTNHLLMRLWDDTKLPMVFQHGDAQRESEWTLMSGAAEYTPERLVLTSLPAGRGLTMLNGSENFTDFTMNVRLTGNKLGAQRIWMRADCDGTQGVVVELRDGDLRVTNACNGVETELFCESLDTLTGVKHASVAADSEAAREAAIKTKKSYGSKSIENAQVMDRLSKETVPADDTEYVPELQLKTTGDYTLSITLRADRLWVYVDGHPAVEAMEVPCEKAGCVLLASEAFSVVGGYSQRNYADDVYDGVFEGLTITADDGQTRLYSYEPSNWRRMVLKIRNGWNSLVDWFITTL